METRDFAVRRGSRPHPFRWERQGPALPASVPLDEMNLPRATEQGPEGKSLQTFVGDCTFMFIGCFSMNEKHSFKNSPESVMNKISILTY